MPHPARLVTADELERMPDDDFRYELVRGRLIRMSPGAPRHGDVTMALGSLLWQHLRTHSLGRVWTKVGFRLFSNPDLAASPAVVAICKQPVTVTHDTGGAGRPRMSRRVEVNPSIPPRRMH